LSVAVEWAAVARATCRQLSRLVVGKPQFTNDPFCGSRARRQAAGMRFLAHRHRRARPVSITPACLRTRRAESECGALVSGPAAGIVVNCGLPTTSRDSWRQVARATAAHSTATLNDTRHAASSNRARSSACSTARDGRRPRKIDVAREEQPNGIVLRASHDGYADTSM